MTKTNELQALMGQLQEDEQQVLEARRGSVEMYYSTGGSGSYYTRKPDDNEGKTRYTRVTRTDALAYLGRAGFSKLEAQGCNSEAVEELLRIQEDHEVAYAGPVPGRRAGYIPEQNILVTRSMSELPVDENGSCEFLREKIAAILGDTVQFDVFESWLHRHFQSVQKLLWCQRQALVLAGPPDTGKGVLHRIIKEVLGGSVVNAYSAIVQNKHNAELFTANVMQIEDLPINKDTECRDKLGSFIYEHSVNEQQQCHPKYGTPFNLVPIRAFIISLNDEPHRVACLPPLTESLMDKVIILRTHNNDEVRVATDEQDQFMASLMSEIKAYRFHLSRYEIPENVSNKRFGVMAHKRSGCLCYAGRRTEHQPGGDHHCSALPRTLAGSRSCGQRDKRDFCRGV